MQKNQNPIEPKEELILVRIIRSSIIVYIHASVQPIYQSKTIRSDTDVLISLTEKTNR